jgi:alpha/beta superfamily hydrolase
MMGSTLLRRLSQRCSVLALMGFAFGDAIHMEFMQAVENAAVKGIFCVVEFWGKVAQPPQNGTK